MLWNVFVDGLSFFWILVLEVGYMGFVVWYVVGR